MGTSTVGRINWPALNFPPINLWIIGPMNYQATRIRRAIKQVRSDIYDINYVEHTSLLDISDLKQAYERSIFRLLDALDYIAQELEYRNDYHDYRV